MPDYETDFYGWANEQAALLRAGRLSDGLLSGDGPRAIDLANLAEEIETMGRSERRELMSRLQVLQQHLRKWAFQPARRGRSWRSTIEEQRRKLHDLLARNPGLRPGLAEAVADAYELARLAAYGEMTDDEDIAFPELNPLTPEQVMDTGFMPDAAGDQ